MEYIIKKIVQYLLTVFLAVTLIFALLRLVPGDPVERILGPQATYEEVQKYRSQLELDMPFLQQYFRYLKGLATFQLGESLFEKKSVFFLIKQRFPPSLTLAIFSTLFAFLLGSTLGVLLALKKNTSFDNWMRVVILLGLSFPIFSLAPVLVFIFAIKLPLFPVSEWGGLKHAILPIITLTIPLSAILSRVVRNRFLDDLSEPWVQVLMSKGLSNLAVWLRAFKVTLPTVLNVIAIQLSVILAGTIITETIFDIPGMGLLLFEAIENRDYPLVQGMMAFITIIYLSIYFLVELLNERIDPRIVK